jgi:hypothetical protein
VELLVSIVNYKSSRLVCEMLEGLVEELDSVASKKVVIIDNDSGDGSVETISTFIKDKQLPDFIDVVAADKNGGFSYGNNAAIKHLKENYQTEPDYVLLLNPDTQVKPGAISELIQFLNANPEIGIAGSRIEDIDGNHQQSAFRFHTLMSELLSSSRLGVLDNAFANYLVAPRTTYIEPTKVDWVAGASMLIRYQVIRDIGLMDETYFLYFEETDFCLKAAKAGWPCWFYPPSRVIHYEGQSTGVMSGDTERRRRPKYWFESRQYYFKNNYGVLYTALADFIWGVGFSLYIVRGFFQKKTATYPKNMWYDFWRNSIFFSWIK